MNDWGLNPGTFQAAGGIATAAALLMVVVSAIFTIKNSNDARRSADAATGATKLAADEAELRTRPWVGVTETDVLEANTDEGSPKQVTMIIKYGNVGVLPAEQLTITGGATAQGRDEPAEPFVSADPFTFFPNELGIQQYVPHPASRVTRWISEGLLIDFEGRFTYQHDTKSYHTTFSASFSFKEPGSPQPAGWRNLEAS